MVAAIPLLVWLGLPRFSQAVEETGPETCAVRRGTFIHEITEHGNVESAKNVDVRCEVDYGGRVMILWIIPEGTYVEPAPDWEPSEPGEEPPDLLVKLDSSWLEDELLEQRIECNSSEAYLIQYQNSYETALINKQQYLEGTYLEQKKKLQGNISLAEEALVRAEQYLADSTVLHEKGFLSDRTLQSDQFDVEEKRIAVERARTALEVLDKYAKPKKLLELEANINTAQSRLESRKHIHHLHMAKLADLEEQIDRCTIRAPQAGQVVYANVTDHRGRERVVIEEGTRMRERQTIIRLPDPRVMQVKAKINEARVALLEKGLPATIELDAFPGTQLNGTVEKVDEFPLPSGWWSGNIKEYEAIVSIHDFPEEVQLRPGMTAKVCVRVERLDDVLLLPVQAVFEHQGRHYCAVRDGQRLAARPVTVGATNDKEVVITEGLDEGREVVLGVASFRDQLDLPEAPEPAPPEPKPDDADQSGGEA